MEGVALVHGDGVVVHDAMTDGEHSDRRWTCFEIPPYCGIVLALA